MPQFEPYPVNPDANVDDDLAPIDEKLVMAEPAERGQVAADGGTWTVAVIPSDLSTDSICFIESETGALSHAGALRIIELIREGRGEEFLRDFAEHTVLSVSETEVLLFRKKALGSDSVFRVVACRVH